MIPSEAHRQPASTSLGHSAPEVPPLDAHNRELLASTHPADWVNPDPAGRYNLVVIGAGTAGLVTAIGAAGLGARVALVERELMGGDCLNVGCVPSKAILSAARVAATVRRADEFGIRVPDGVNVEFVVRRGDRHVAMRVHERGSGETRSCGTGACAVMVAAAVADGVSSPPAEDVSYRVDVPGGTLTVTWTADNRVLLTGPAVVVARGVTSL